MKLAKAVKCIVFLDDLRASGKLNMFGAAPYLAARCDLPIEDARSILGQWMKMDLGQPAGTRAAALASTEPRT